ncbi:MAG: hypothetical protein IPI43_24975 [Sandaracinaceae bacterium]|nr:hypothetical protein [Sandaracinaceae bacterium]
MTARTVRRLCRAYEAHGPAGLVSQSRGRRSNRHRRACRGELIQVSSSRSTGATTTGSRTVLREPSPAGVRRRRDERAHGGALRRRRDHLWVLRVRAALPPAAWPAGRVLQRQGEHLPSESQGPWRHGPDAVRARHAGPEHRRPVRQLRTRQGPRRARQQDAAGPTREGAETPGHQRHRRGERLPRCSLPRCLQPTLCLRS